MAFYRFNSTSVVQQFAVVLASLLAVFVAACGGASVKTTAPVTSNGLTVSCTPAIMAPSTTSQCSATVVGVSNPTISWSASGGTITAAGLFTAPDSTGSVTIKASNSQNSAETGTENLTVQLKMPASQHVVMLMEENQDYTTTVGNTVGWPNLNKLMQQGAVATNYYADVHPSIGNYFMLTTGQTVTTDDSSKKIWYVDNIARQVIVPFSQFAIDVSNNALPQFSFIVPDIDNDAHSASQQQADTWMQSNIVAPLASLPAFKAGGDGILIVNFDEGLGSDTA